jgi:hypothetical protein
MGGRGKATVVNPRVDGEIVLVDQHKGGKKRYRLAGHVKDGKFHEISSDTARGRWSGMSGEASAPESAENRKTRWLCA